MQRHHLSPVRTLLLVAVFGLGPETAANATLGGPDVATVLGWNAAEGRLYFVVEGGGESVRRPRLFALDIKSSSREELKALELTSWPDVNEGNFSLEEIDRILANTTRKLDELQKGLVKLPARRPDDLTLSVRTLSSENHTLPSTDVVSRSELELLVTEGSRAGRTRVTAYCNREARIKEWYRIPESGDSVVSLEYTAIPDETRYTSWAFLLLGNEGRTPRP